MFILNFSLILYSILFFALFLFLGLGLTILCCPREWRKYTVFLSPLIGYCLLTLAGWFFYSLNFKGTNDYYYWILLIALILLVGAVIKIWKQKFLRELFSRELITPILIAVIIFLVVAFPALRQQDMTSMSLGNNDIAFYTLGSKMIQTMPKSDFHLINYFESDLTNYMFGAYINTAFFCSVAKLDPYQVQMISIFVFFIISLFLTYILAREVFRYTGFAANVVLLLLGLSSMVYNVVYQGFERQIIAVPLMLLVILSSIAIVRANKLRDALRYAPFLFLALWGLSLTYSHMLVIIYGLIIPYVLLSCWKNKTVAKLLNWAAISFIAVLIIVCLSPQRAQVIITTTLLSSNSAAGWFIPWIIPQKLYGITPFLTPDIFSFNPDTLAALACSNYSLTFTTIVALLLAAVIGCGFVKLYKNDMENFLFSLSSFLLIFAGASILSVQNINREVSGGFGGYNQFKLISFFLPVLLLSSFALFRDMTFNLRSVFQPPVKSSREYLSIRKNTLYFLIIAALVISNCVSAAATLYDTHKLVNVIPSDTVNLQTIGNNKEIKSINIPAGDPAYRAKSFWYIMWEAYFLYPHKLYFEQSTYYAATPLNGDWWLIRNTGGSAEQVLSILRKTDSNTMPINSAYALSKSAPHSPVRFGNGWSVDEVDHRWTTSNVASIIINSTAENLRTDLTLKYGALNKDNNLSVYMNNVKIMDCDNDSSCVIKNLLLNKGENILELKAKLPAELPGNGDPRKLCYCFKLIQIEEVE